MPAIRLSSLRTPIQARLSNIQGIGPRRCFSSSRLLNKESESPSEEKAQKIEREKQAQLADQKQGRNQWNDSLGSDSESIVKADRGELNTDQKTIKELQDESAKAAQKEKEQKGN